MGFSNQVGLLKYALTQAGIKGLVLPEPQRSLDFGYYYPALAGPKGPALLEGPALLDRHFTLTLTWALVQQH